MEVKIGNLKVYFESQGSGPDILLLHGWAANTVYFQGLMQGLADSYRVTAIDFPGFGKSDFPPQAWNLEQYGQFLSQLIKKLDLKKPVLLGHSFGGAVALKSLSLDPELASKLILIDSAGVRLFSVKKSVGLALSKAGKLVFNLPPLKPAYRRARRQWYRLLGVLDFCQADERLHDTFVSVVKEDLRPILSQVSLPTLIIWGENDQDTPLKQGRVMHQLLPNSQFKVIKNAAHVPFGTHLEECLNLIKEFIDEKT